MFYSMARRLREIQGWATAPIAHYNHQRGRCLTHQEFDPDSSRGTWRQPGTEDTRSADSPLRSNWGREPCPPDSYHVRTRSVLVCSALACGMMHGASIEPRNRPRHPSAKPPWRCQAACAKSTGAVSLRDAHPSCPEVNSGARAGRRGISLYELGFPIPTDPDH